MPINSKSKRVTRKIRKESSKFNFSIRLRPYELTYLETIINKTGVSQSHIIRGMLRWCDTSLALVALEPVDSPVLRGIILKGKY